MTKVTKESLSARIAELESGTRSIKEDYQLEAYRMLLHHVSKGEMQSSCSHDWWNEQFMEGSSQICLKCGKGRSF